MKIHAHAPMTIRFWKMVGNDTYCVWVNRQWHYVGNTTKDFLIMRDYYLNLGRRLERVQSIPAKIARHAATIASLKNNLSKWNPT